MKVTYLLQNPGITSRTPQGWSSAVIAARPDGTYPEEALKETEDADFLVVGLQPVPETILARAKRVKLIQRLGVGYDNIDLEAATRYGIAVCNMPDFNAATVAEHTIMLMLAILRRVHESTFLMKAGKWPLATVVASGIYDLQSKTVGLLGMGGIGQAVAGRLKPFDVTLLYYDQCRLPRNMEESLGLSSVSLGELLRSSDVLTIHLPLTPETRGLIGKTELEKMKPSAILINTGRGAIVDEMALADALQRSRIAGAGLDVFAEEPLDPRHPLRRCPNVLLTPHTAGQTREAMDRMVAMMLENISRVVRGDPPLYRVNVP